MRLRARGENVYIVTSEVGVNEREFWGRCAEIWCAEIDDCRLKSVKNGPFAAQSE